MGKQAKKKQKTEAQVKGQKRHNSATRGINTKKRGPTWSIRQVAIRNKKGVVQKDEHGKVLTEEVHIQVPIGVGFDMFGKYDENSPEPFDALALDWRQEIMEYAADIGAKVGKIDKGNGIGLYRVYRGDNIYQPDELYLEVESPKRFTLEKRR